jgi:hypothetical protein
VGLECGLGDSPQGDSERRLSCVPEFRPWLDVVPWPSPLPGLSSLPTEEMPTVATRSTGGTHMGTCDWEVEGQQDGDGFEVHTCCYLRSFFHWIKRLARGTGPGLWDLERETESIFAVHLLVPRAGVMGLCWCLRSQ